MGINLEPTCVFSPSCRFLASAQDSNTAALARVEKTDLELQNRQREIDRLHNQRRSLNADIASLQQHLTGRERLSKEPPGSLRLCWAFHSHQTSPNL